MIMSKITAVTFFVQALLSNNDTLIMKLDIRGPVGLNQPNVFEMTIAQLAAKFAAQGVRIKRLRLLSFDDYQKVKRRLPPENTEKFTL